MAQASFIFAREFGWLPQQVQEMTMAQVSMYMQMIKENVGNPAHDN